MVLIYFKNLPFVLFTSESSLPDVSGALESEVDVSQGAVNSLRSCVVVYEEPSRLQSMGSLGVGQD